MTDSGTVDVHIGPYHYTNDIRVNLWLSYDVPFTPRYFTKPDVGCISIILIHHHARCTDLLVTDFVLLSR